MRRWPWITLLLAAVLSLNPIGLDFFRAAFLSGEQLTRNIAQPIYLIVLAIVGALVALEWWIRRVISRRRVN